LYFQLISYSFEIITNRFCIISFFNFIVQIIVIKIQGLKRIMNSFVEKVLLTLTNL